jgi:methylthioxylose transferase
VTAPQPPFTGPVDAYAPERERHHQLRPIGVWLFLLVVTLTLAAVAQLLSDVVGPRTLPWWPSRDGALTLTPGGVIAPATAIGVLLFASRPATARLSWPALIVSSYLASLLWSASLHTNVDATIAPGDAAGAALLLWALTAMTGSAAGLAIAVTAISALTVPFALVAARSVCGPVAARGIAPVLILGPWAAWSTLGVDGITAAVCAAVLAAGALASEAGMRGYRAASAAAGTGVLLGTAALLSYGAAWFAVSLLCLYFVRRRPGHILVSAGAALAVLAAAAAFGASWPAGLLDVFNAASGELAAHPGQLWWLLLMPALVCAASGPAVVESLRRFGSSRAWPLMVGPLAALLLSPLSGANPDHPEYAWVVLCPWLVLAATTSPDGRSVRAPLLMAAVGATVAVLFMWSG